MAKKKSKGKFYSVKVIEKNLKDHVVEWLATVLSLVGASMIAYQIKNGFYVWILANIFWISFSWKHKHYGLLFLSTSYLVINIIGLINWNS